MSEASLLAGADLVLVDTNVFVALGQPSNPAYQQFRRVIRRAEIVVRLPQRVVGELGGPETKPVQQALEEGWAEIVDAPAITDGDAMQASDIPRRTIASLTDQPDHDVEKADTIFAGLAVQYLREQAVSDVVVLTDDASARQGIETAVHEQGYTNGVSVYGVTDILGEDPGDSLTLI